MKNTYIALTVLLLLAVAFLATKGFPLRDINFGLGLGYVLPAVICLGLAIVTGFMAAMEHGAQRQEVAEQ